MGRFEYLTRRYPFGGYLAFVSWFLKYLPSLGTSQSEGVRSKSQSRRYCGRLAEMGFPQRDGIGGYKALFISLTIRFDRLWMVELSLTAVCSEVEPHHRKYTSACIGGPLRKEVCIDGMGGSITVQTAIELNNYANR